MLLSDKRILEEMDKGNVIIEPFERRQLGTNSYDVRLGQWYFLPNHNMVTVSFFDAEQSRNFWGDPQQARDGMIAIRPGDTILAHTEEIIGGQNGFTTSISPSST